MALLPSDPRQQKRILIGLVPLVLFFLYWYFPYQKKAESITEMRSHVEQLETSNRVAHAKMAQGGPDLEKKVDLYEQYMRRLERLIPDREEVPELLHAMTVQAQDNGVELGLMAPQQEEPETYYTREVYKMAVLGSYHDVGRFLASIGSLPRIVTPVDLEIDAAPSPARDGSPRVQASFRIETFVIPAPGADSASTVQTTKGR